MTPPAVFWWWDERFASLTGPDWIIDAIVAEHRLGTSVPLPSGLAEVAWMHRDFTPASTSLRGIVQRAGGVLVDAAPPAPSTRPVSTATSA